MRRSRCWVLKYSTCLFSAAEAASSVRTRRECGRGRGMRWMMQNGKEADRLLTVPSVHITLATTSVFTTKEGQVKASNCYWISLSGNLHSCSVSWTLVLASVWKERGQVEISILTNTPPHTHTVLCTPATPPCCSLSTVCLLKFIHWSAKWTSPVGVCVAGSSSYAFSHVPSR